MALGSLTNKATSVQESVRQFLTRLKDQESGDIAFLIACSKAKRAYRAPARDLYRSGRFQTQLRIAENLSRDVFVLSAKHGIVSLEAELDPYDVTYPFGIFADHIAIKDIEKLYDSRMSTVYFFGGNRYLQVLRQKIDHKITVEAPFEHLNSFETSLWCRIVEDYLLRRTVAPDIYKKLESLADTFGLHELASFPTIKSLPERGLYFFFDPEESTEYSVGLPRLVRVGTHAVSQGSKSNLRTRLRAHFGQQDRTGNHRASIFRLHVGAALLSQLPDEKSSLTWGKGMSAAKDVRDVEAAIEQRVSKYLGKLLFTYVPLADAPSVNSQRSLLEKAAINFFGADRIPLDCPGQGWLGFRSRHEVIAATGLWNIQHNGLRYDRRSAKVITQILQNPMLAES